MRLRPFRLLLLSLLLLAIQPVRAGSKKAEITVSFHTEANRNDGPSFAMPINLEYGRRTVYISRVPDFSQSNIERIYPFQARNGTWGCVFKLNPAGRLRLETMTGEVRGTVMVVFIATKLGRHQVVDMVIDRQVVDGIPTVPFGMTEMEVMMLKKEFKMAGDNKLGPREKPEDRPMEPTDGRIDRPQQKRTEPKTPPLFVPSQKDKPSRGSSSRGGSEPDLPRLAD